MLGVNSRSHLSAAGDLNAHYGFVQKAGWRDSSNRRLAKLLQVTRFNFIELDEGRTPPDS
jgi:hypothetical protein